MQNSQKISFRKTRKGRISKIVQETYLRDDIPSGLKKSQESLENPGILDLESDNEKFIYILDTNTFLNQIDLIENCPILNNVVVLQTVLEEIRLKNQQTFETLRNLITAETHRKFYVFNNEFFKATYVEKQPNETFAARNERAIIVAAEWYTKHCAQYNIDVLFISNSFKMLESAKEKNVKGCTIFEFIQTYCGDYPDLIDYLGFEEHSQMDIEPEEEKKAIYDAHMNQTDLLNAIRAGEIFQGKVAVNRNNYEDGRAFIPKYGIEIKLKGLNNLNRALNGDVVGIKLLPESEWVTVQEAVFEDEEDVIGAGTESAHPVEVEENETLKKLIERIVKQNLTPAGRVVGIVKRIQRNFCGQLKPREETMDIEESVTVREFIPADSRYPPILISLKNAKLLETKKIVAKFDSWSISSKFPRGHFVRVIGDIGDLDTEQKVILLEHNVELRNFSKQVYDCLPPEGEKWQIPEQEYKVRKDLRSYNICSIDPPGCKDIDDALHSRVLPNGNIEIGVHIADVTYYVRPDTAIDLEAANRCTTVYLVGRRTDMLPKLLTETLCSLKCDVERLAFSVVWEMTNDAKVVKVDFFKSIILSKASLTYKEAQQRLDDKEDHSELTESIRGLYRIGKILRQRRIQNGALTLASTQVKFSFDDETHNPTDVSFYDMLETNYLVEEFMLLANIAVAEKILYHFPSNSVLRRHSTPKPKQMKEFAQLLEKLGYNMDYSTSKNLADSLDAIQRKDEPFFNKLVRILTTRCMNEATYISTADYDYPEFHHYGLAASVYTHFTSPIRRYADVLVHRLLAAAIDLESLPKNMCNKQRLTRLCDKMNMRNRNARNASRASSDYNTYLFFRGKTVIEPGMISSIQTNGVNVVIPKYGLEGFIQFSPEEEKLNAKQFVATVGETGPKIVSEIILKGKTQRIFDRIWVKVSVELEHFHKKIKVEYIGNEPPSDLKMIEEEPKS